VFRLATLLASDVLDAQIIGRPIADSHIRSLLEASLLLREYEVELPPLLRQIMRGVDQTGVGGVVYADSVEFIPQNGDGAGVRLQKK
jgi:hypothetical protein